MADVTRQHPEDRDLKQIALLYERGVEEYIEAARRKGIQVLREEAEKFQRAAWAQYPQSAVDPPANGPYFQANDPDGFSIIIVAGVPLYDESDRPLLPHGTSTITGVQIAGRSTVIDASGEPVLEQYSFIAKDVSGPAFRR